MSEQTSHIPLDSRLLNAMKRLRLDNIQLQKQLREYQSDFGQASSQAVDGAFRSRELEIELHQARQQLVELAELKQRLEAAETAREQWEAQRTVLSDLNHRQTLEIQEMRVELRHSEEECRRLSQANQAGSQELERVKTQARQVIVEHYQAMKSAQEQAQQANDEVRRMRAQVDAIRPTNSAGARRKALPPRSLRPTTSGANHS